MPNLRIDKDRFDELMGAKYTFQELDQLGFQFGIQVQEEVEEDKELQTKTQYYKFQCMNNRPDLLSQNSLVRTLKIYLNKLETPQMKLTKPTYQIIVDKSVKQIRPYVVGAILKNIKFDQKNYKSFINTQEKLHVTFCRNRKFVSMGTHNLDSIQGPFYYVAKNPKDFNFIPLSQKEGVDGHGLMKSLENHKLKQYLPLIKDSPVYPLILDSNGLVCSVPPIINSQHSKISIDTKNVFIQITALSKPKALIALNTLIWAFSEYCQVPFQIQPIEIIDGQQKYTTPDISQKQFTVQHKNAQKLIGAKLTQQQILSYVKRTGLRGQIINEQSYKVYIPSWRPDVLHECDILEDIAICYGYTKIVPALPPTSTIGSQLRINKFTDFLRQQMAQAQFNEVLNFALCSKADLTTNILNNDDSKLITLQSSQEKLFQTGRTTLLPGLLRTILQNKSIGLPYKIFQAGDCIILDSTTDTGARNLKKLALAMTDQIIQGNKKDIFSHAHGVFDLIMKKCSLEFGKDYSLKLSNSGFYLPKQQFQILLNGQFLGSLGVVHPKVVKNFGWIHPTVMWEIDVQLLAKKFFSRHD